MKHLPKIITLLLISLFVFTCQNDDNYDATVEIQQETKVINIKTIYGKQIPKNIINYLLEKTNNTLKFNLSDELITPITDNNRVFSRDTLEIGTVNTSASAMVVNETNIKYTFVMTNSDTSSKHNLIVVDINGDLMNYYIKYTPDATWAETHSMKTDMYNYKGSITFYSKTGIQTGNLELIDGEIDEDNSDDWIYDPCDPDNIPDWWNDGNDSTGSGGDGGYDSNGNNDPDGADYGTGGSGGGGSGEMCTFTLGRECSAGGGHTTAANCSSEDGWSITVTVPCPPNVSNSRNSQNARGGEIVNPCAGDVALLFENIDFDDSWLPYQCQKNIVTEALAVSSTITDSISNVFSSERIHITNKVEDFSTTWTPHAKTDQDIGVSSIITYDTDLIEGSTDLLIVSAAQHESFHALLNYLVLSGSIVVDDPDPDINTLVEAFLSALNDSDPTTDTNDPTHHYMVTIINQFKNSLKAYGESKGYVIEDEYYKNLAWIGLTDTAAFNSIYDDPAIKSQLIEAIGQTEYTNAPNAKGVKCTN